MPVAIKIENLSKQYRLGQVSTRTLSHDLNRWWTVNILGKDDPYLKISDASTPLSTGGARGGGRDLRDLSERSDLSETHPTAKSQSREGKDLPLRPGASAVKEKSEIRIQNSLITNPAPLSALRPPPKGNGSEYIWALKDINLEVEQGEILGIIGKNGAGKSTLLKILSKVTAPTTGTIKTRGRIASLLEVGTGFHPEMTGRENIYMNGAIMGMTRSEITRKFEEIVDFSGVEQFIDTPAKRYSSGMLVRLGFAVAAHLEPEILVVDEVLAVGDAEFQKKAIGKMQDITSGLGRTVLFVSHNMAAVKTLCKNCILLADGKIQLISSNLNELIEHYLAESLITGNIHISQRTDRSGNQTVKIVDLELVGMNKNGYFQNDQPLKFSIKYKGASSIYNPRILMSINDQNDQTIIFFDSSTTNIPIELKEKGTIAINTTENFGLSSGKYFLNIALLSNETMVDYVKNAVLFNVIDGAFYPNGKLPSSKSICHIRQNWSFE